MFALLIGQNMFKNKELVELPCRVLLERSGRKFFDSDNMVASCKAVKDIVASHILKKKRGVDDDNPGIEWVYKQIKGDYALRIEITWGDEWEKTT